MRPELGRYAKKWFDTTATYLNSNFMQCGGPQKICP